MSEKVEEKKCPACGGYVVHRLNCPAMTEAGVREQLMQYYNSWLKHQKEAQAQWERYRRELVLWQGKHAILRRENNKLRHQLRRLLEPQYAALHKPKAPGRSEDPHRQSKLASSHLVQFQAHCGDCADCRNVLERFYAEAPQGNYRLCEKGKAILKSSALHTFVPHPDGSCRICSYPKADPIHAFKGVGGTLYRLE